jgi:hypothetical protein
MATTAENEFDQQVATLRSAFAQYPGMYPSEGFFKLQAFPVCVGRLLITPVLDFPKPGILFFDCLPIFENPDTFNLLVDPSSIVFI